ncbi:MAG TPA: ABC transporter permease [Lichenihabitans sp.]|jgi:ribose transport system permease protein|nr:ABC transporter permease [Lichenihabitans sp.]
MSMPRGRAQRSSALTQAVSVWGLLLLLALLIVVFSALRPDTFPTYFNFRSIINNKAISALLALAVFLPMTANHFDLSVGFLLGIAQVLAIGLQGQGLGPIEASVVVLLLGAVVGLLNGVLVTIVGIDSFIATLGTGTLLYGLNEWYTGGQQVVASLPESFVGLSGTIFNIPLPALYVLALSLLLWVVFEYLPAGRHLYVLGANPRAAELNGISARRYVTVAFVGAGVTAAFAGIVLQSQLQVGQSSVGQEYLLPAFTAALLGATSIRPGRVNVWGTILAVAVLAVTVAGLNQLGAPFFVEPIFDGAMLILAVGLAVTAARRRIRLGAAVSDAPAAAGERPGERP